MGLSGLSVGHLLVVLLVVILVFGTKRLGSVGTDLAEAIKSFRKAMASDDDASRPAGQSDNASTQEALSRSADAKADTAVGTNPASGPTPRAPG